LNCRFFPNLYLLNFAAKTLSHLFTLILIELYLHNKIYIRNVRTYPLTIRNYPQIHGDNQRIKLRSSSLCSKAARLQSRSKSILMQHAVNSKFNPPNNRGSNQRNQRPQQSDEEIIRKYIEFVQRKNAEWSPLQALFGLVKGLVFASLGLLSALGKFLPI